MAVHGEVAEQIMASLYQIARSPGIAEVGYTSLGYDIPGIENWEAMESVSRLESQCLIEIVEHKRHAYFYLPRFLVETTDENRMAADRLRIMPYPDYLGTWEWSRRKRLVRMRDSDQCSWCGLCVDVAQLHVHHKTYERRGVERLSDLTTLCASCHSDAHRWDREAS